MIQLVASDMDGTLLNHHMDISPENRKAIKKLQEHGIPFVIATGRHLTELLPLINKYRITCPLITANGGAVYNAQQELIKTHHIDSQVVLSIIEASKQFSDVYTEIMTVDGVVADNEQYRENEIIAFIKTHHPTLTGEDFEKFLQEKKDSLPAQFVPSLTEYITTENPTIIKIIAITKHSIEQLEQFKQAISSLSGVTISSSYVTNLEITSPQGQKGIALAEVAHDLGVSMEDVMALGDNMNDYSMISSVGYGIAMGNAVNTIKDIARDITDTNVNHGVAKAIEKHIFDTSNSELSHSTASTSKAASASTESVPPLNKVIKQFNRNVLKRSWAYVIAICLIALLIIQFYRSVAAPTATSKHTSSLQQKIEHLEQQLSEQSQRLQHLEKQVESLKNKP